MADAFKLTRKNPNATDFTEKFRFDLKKFPA